MLVTFKVFVLSYSGPSTEVVYFLFDSTFLFRTWSALFSSENQVLKLLGLGRNVIVAPSYSGTRNDTFCVLKVYSNPVEFLQLTLCRNTIVIQCHIITQRYARIQFTVPLARINPICSSDPKCHFLRSLLTSILGAEMNVGARVTFDTEFFCWCYAVQPQDILLQNMSDPWHSVVLPVLCVYLLECLRSSKSCCR